jgi:hypothetical protein
MPILLSKVHVEPGKETAMKGLQKVGAAGAVLMAISFVLLIVGNAVILPSLGIGQADQDNPAKLLPVASTVRLLYSIPILFAAAFTLTTLGLNERLQEQSPGLMRIATASGLGAAVLFLAAGMFAFGGLQVLGDIYARDPASVTATDLALADQVDTGLLAAGVFAAGWWALLCNWAGLQGGLPRLLSYLGLLFGVLGILGFAIPAVSILGALVGIVWAVWLAIVLWTS